MLGESEVQAAFFLSLIRTIECRRFGLSHYKMVCLFYPSGKEYVLVAVCNLGSTCSNSSKRFIQCNYYMARRVPYYWLRLLRAAFPSKNPLHVGVHSLVMMADGCTGNNQF